MTSDSVLGTWAEISIFRKDAADLRARVLGTRGCGSLDLGFPSPGEWRRQTSGSSAHRRLRDGLEHHKKQRIFPELKVRWMLLTRLECVCINYSYRLQGLLALWPNIPRLLCLLTVTGTGQEPTGTVARAGDTVSALLRFLSRLSFESSIITLC